MGIIWLLPLYTGSEHISVESILNLELTIGSFIKGPSLQVQSKPWIISFFTEYKLLVSFSIGRV